MTNIMLADDARYGELFDVGREAARHGSENYDDFYELIATLRAQTPVHAASINVLLGIQPNAGFVHGRPHYTCLSFESVNKVLLNNELYSSAIYDEFAPSAAIGKTILNMGGVEHRRYRNIVQSLFTKTQANGRWRENWINAIVDELISSFEGDGRADLNSQFNAKLPMFTITRAFGLPDEEALTFRYNLLRSSAHDVDAEERQRSAQVVRTMLMGLIGERRLDPRDDIVTQLANASFVEDDGGTYCLDDEEIMSFCRIIMIAGGGTTWRQLGITTLALLTHPEQLEAVRADRSLVEKAVWEAARWNPTDPVFYRLTTAESVLDGVTIPAGSIVDMCLGAANRDPQAFDQPDAFDLLRRNARHVGFSGGAHTCLGMWVAQSEMIVAINALLDRLPGIRLDPSRPTPRISGAFERRGVDHLSVVF